MLRTSYRLTPAIANFVNKNILKEDLIIGGNTKMQNILPIYNYSAWNITELIETLVRKYGPDEVVIIKASITQIRENTPLGKLVSSNTIKFCHRENEALSDEVMAGKVLISSFNGMKGRERKCVIVFGFDESYFEYYNKEWNEPYLPNIIYVAVTRAKQSLVLIQDDKKQPFRTTNKNLIRETCQVIGEQDIYVQKNHGKPYYTITELVKHRNTSDMIDMLKLIQSISIIQAEKSLVYETLIPFGNYYEDMRTYYGTLIPLIANFKLNGLEKIEHNLHCVPEHIAERFKQLCNNKTLKEWMEFVVIQHAMKSGHYFYVDQILNYDWVDEKFINDASDRIINAIPKDGKFNFFIEKDKLIGEIDYINQDIWEFKCTTSLTDEHYIQCAAYISLYYIINNKLLTGKLYNTRTNELVEITVENPTLFIQLLRNRI